MKVLRKKKGREKERKKEKEMENMMETSRAAFQYSIQRQAQPRESSN